MLKKEELISGCMAKADDDEMTFVLLARDKDAPDTIRDWVTRRIASGKNLVTDAQITEALRCAEVMEKQYRQRYGRRKAKGKR